MGSVMWGVWVEGRVRVVVCVELTEKPVGLDAWKKVNRLVWCVWVVVGGE